MVVFLFLRRLVPTFAAMIAVPLSLAGTVTAMWFSGFSIDNVSLLALTISVGFVVDDAIVVIENCYRNMQGGLNPVQAALAGARQIGFTIVSISLSLVAAFIPLLFMGGVLGKILQEFGWTLTFAILISAVVSLTLTPMVCGRFMRRLPVPARDLARPPRRAGDGGDRPRLCPFAGLGARPSLADAGGDLHRAGAFGDDLHRAAEGAHSARRFNDLLFGFTRASPDVSFEKLTPCSAR